MKSKIGHTEFSKNFCELLDGMSRYADNLSDHSSDNLSSNNIHNSNYWY